MLTYSFINIGSDSLYEHLYKCIKNDIIQGILKSGDKLPSKRSFAKNLGISVITVERAYEQLIAEGYIYSIAKKGFYVVDFKNLGELSNKIKIKKENKIIEKTKSEYKINFSSNMGLKEQFPFTVWSKILRDCLNDFQESILINPPSNGDILLRNAISKHLKDFRGMIVQPEQIIIGAGSEYLYGQIIQLLGHDKIYGVEDPGYKKMGKIFEANDVLVKYINFERDGISISELEKEKVQITQTSPSHQFPTGIVTPISKRYELLAWAAKDKDRYIIEDDYDSEFRMISKPIPTLMSIDTMEKVIYMNTFSKSISTTLRISYMVLPKHLMNLYYEKMSFYNCPVAKIIQLSLYKFIEDGYFEKHINRMRNFYKKQRDYLLKEIKKSKMSKYANISEEDSGLHFILNLDISCSDEEFKQRLRNHNINISALSEFYHRKENKTEHDFVINYSSLTTEDIKTAVEILDEEVMKVKN